jgi:hypothetical protein
MKFRALSALGCVLLTSMAALAQDADRYPNGTSGIKGGTVPPPGEYWLMYNLFYTSNQLIDPSGKPATNSSGKPIDFNVSLYANASRFFEVTNYKIFGADFAFDFVFPVVDQTIAIPGSGVAANALAIGDLNIEPIVIEWHKPRYDFGFVYGFFAPTGQRDPVNIAYAGQGFWTNYIGPAGTLYFDKEKTWTASFLSRYEFNSENPNTHITEGDVFSFEWGAGKTFMKSLDVGVAGYCSWETTHDTGPGNFVPPTLARSMGIGPEIQYFSSDNKMGFHLRHEWEFDVRNRSKGQLTTLTFVFPF